MSSFELAIEVENLSVQIDRACAVLYEVEHYFETKDDVEHLPHYAAHILLLLHVVDSLLWDMPPKMNGIASILHEKHGKELQK